MNERDEFASFAIGMDDLGRPRVVFHLLQTSWHWDASTVSNTAPVTESVFDEPSLIVRIANLRRQGFDASFSEAALAALREVSPGSAAAPPSVLGRVPGSTLTAVVEAFDDGVLVATVGGHRTDNQRIVYINPAFTQLTGYTAADLLACDPGTLLHHAGTGREPERAAETAMLTGQPAHCVMLLARKVGMSLRVQGSVLPLRDASLGRITHLAWILRPASTTVEAIAAAAERDSVTGLLARDAFLEAVLAEVTAATARQPCLVLLRVGEIAALAGQHGEGIRPALLLGVADRLLENLRRIDLIGYMGDDNFAVCLPRVGLAGAHAIVERLRAAIAAEPVETSVGLRQVTMVSTVLQASSAASPASREQPGTTSGKVTADELSRVLDAMAKTLGDGGTQKIVAAGT